MISVVTTPLLPLPSGFPVTVVHNYKFMSSEQTFPHIQVCAQLQKYGFHYAIIINAKNFKHVFV